MTLIEIMALIIVILGAVKIIVILIKPRSWAKVVNLVYEKPAVTMIVALLLAMIVLKYLLTELTIVQIFAVMLFLALLMAVGVASYAKETTSLANKLLKDRHVLKKGWLAILIWIILMIWVLYELLA